MPRSTGLVLLGLTVLLAACNPSGTPPTTPNANAGNFFPSADIAFSKASPELQAIWAPYQTQTIPGRQVLAALPPEPPVFNLTNGALSNLQADDWATAYMRDAVWQRWAAAHAQSDFMGHINPAFDTATFSQGATETLPDCYLFPTSLAIVEQAASISSSGSTFVLIAAYHGPCKTTFNLPDGQQQDGDSFDGDISVRLTGYVANDPVLGEIWVTLGTTSCSEDICPALPSSPPADVSRPELPGQALPLSQASPALQTIWQPYAVQLIPPVTVPRQLPRVPAVGNFTNGAVSDQLAQEWGEDLFRDAAWLRWSWLALQLDFQKSISDSSLLNNNLVTDAGQGGRPAIPACAVYPQSLELHSIDSDTRSHVGNVNNDAYYFLATYSKPCTAQVSFPDGHSSNEDVSPGSLQLFGSVREDPLLGDIWFTDNAAQPQS